MSKLYSYSIRLSKVVFNAINMTAQVSTVWEMFNQLDIDGKNQFLTKLVGTFHTSTTTISPELKAHIEARHLASTKPNAVHYNWTEAKEKIKEALANRRRHA
ncbi:MAG: hypothetical protein AAGG68_10210 [Bacteroidota bacterium]